MIKEAELGDHTLSPSAGEAEAGASLEFKVRLVYKLSFRPAIAAMVPCLKKKLHIFWGVKKTAVRFSGMDIDGLVMKILKCRMLLAAVCMCVMILIVKVSMGLCD